MEEKSRAYEDLLNRKLNGFSDSLNANKMNIKDSKMTSSKENKKIDKTELESLENELIDSFLRSSKSTSRVIGGEVVYEPSPVSYSDNENNYEDYFHLHNSINQASIENSDMNDAMTIDELGREFKKFDGDYVNFAENFDSMSERDQKLFIIYSIFHFNYKFDFVNPENLERIFSSAVMKERKRMEEEYRNYSVVRKCDIGCDISLDGKPTLSGEGFNVSCFMKSRKIIKNIDSINLEDLLKLFENGYRYTASPSDEEAEALEYLNKKLQNELGAFRELMDRLSKQRKR